MDRRIRWVGIASVGAVAFVMSDAVAQPQQPRPPQARPSLYSDDRPAPPPYILPPAPALPAGCAAPTKDQCADSNWYKTNACASDPAKSKGTQDYCTWVMQKAWLDTQADARQALFPTSPPSSVYPVLTPGRADPHGKGVTPGTTNRPAEKRRFPGSGARAQVPTAATGPTSMNWTPNKMLAGGGSYAGIHTAAILPHVGNVQNKLQPLRQANANEAAQRAAAGPITQMLQQKPSFVTPGAGVTSCEEYAYKRWGDWSDYANAAKKLGTNYRQVYKTAIDPASPFFLNKPILNQTLSTKRIPVQVYQAFDSPYWFPDYKTSGTNSIGQNVGDDYVYPWISDYDKILPANAFISHRAYWLTDPKATTQNGKPLITDAEKAQVKALMDAQWSLNLQVPRRVTAKNASTPLAVHVEMKALLDKKYGDPLDDELADAEKRTGVYQDLLVKADALRMELACDSAADVCFRCSPPPHSGGRQLPGSIQNIKDKLTGAPVINPGDVGSIFQTGSMASRMRSLAAMNQVGGAFADIYGGSRGASLGGAKQKGAPVLAQPRGQAADPVAQCKAGLEAKRPAVEDSYYEVAQQLTKLLANELKFGDRGCLANPGGDIGNLCDWSYAKFAAYTSTLFDSKVEVDFQQCRSEINTATAALTPKPTGNSFTAILKDPRNQALTFPCVQRRDFTGSAPDANWFFRLSGNYIGRLCEAARVDLSIADQQAAIMDQLTGIRFKQGEIYDVTADNNVLGSKDSLGAYFDYDANWSMVKTGSAAGGDPMKACRFDGAGGTNIKTGIYFFGDDIPLFGMNSQGKTNGSQPPTVSMNAHYLDIDSFTQKSLASVKDKSVPPGHDYTVPLVQPPVSLGGIEYGFWVQVGPIPLHIKFGATATAGLDYHFVAQTGDNCAGFTGDAPIKPSGFHILSKLEPWVRADAYADASVDIVIAAAGVRLDLELLRLGLPIGVDVASTDTKQYSFKNGMSVTIDMLAGRFSAYAEIGIGPLSAEVDVTIFSWDGFHHETQLWGLDKTLPEGVVRVAMANYIDPGQVKCSCNETFCCSNLSCGAGAADHACTATTKKVNGDNKVCTFSQTDFNRIMTSTDPKIVSMRTTDMQKCQWLVK